MDREILFRGQTRKRGEKVRMDGTLVDGNWVYGGIFPGEGDFSIIYSSHPVKKHVVYTDTVDQYTGLTDKNGVKIFEGDIVRFPWELGQATDTVIFRDGGFTLTHYWWATVLDGKAEVIGNIHDNPELIGGEDDG